MRKIIALLALMAPVVLAPAVMATAAHAEDTQGYATVGFQDSDIGKLGKGFNAINVGAAFIVSPYIAVEGNVALGTNSAKTTVINLPAKSKLQNQMSAYVVGIYPLSKDLDVLVKAGMLVNKLRASAAAYTTNQQASGPSLGVGLHYYPNGGNNGVALDLSHSDFARKGQDNVAQLSFVHRF